MKKVEFFIGRRPFPKGIIYLTPSLYVNSNRDNCSLTHYFSIESQWIFYGIGLIFRWENKEYVDSSLEWLGELNSDRNENY